MSGPDFLGRRDSLAGAAAFASAGDRVPGSRRVPPRGPTGRSRRLRSRLRPFQFSLKTLLVVVTAFAVLFGSVVSLGAAGVAVWILAVLLAWKINSPPRGHRPMTRARVIRTFLLSFAIFMGPSTYLCGVVHHAPLAMVIAPIAPLLYAPGGLFLSLMTLATVSQAIRHFERKVFRVSAHICLTLYWVTSLAVLPIGVQPAFPWP